MGLQVMTERELTSSSARLTRLLALVEAGQEDETATHAAIERLNQELVDLALEVDCYAINLNMKYTLKMGQVRWRSQLHGLFCAGSSRPMLLSEPIHTLGCWAMR